MRVFVCEFTETHHNTFETVYRIARKIWGDGVWGIVTADVYSKLPPFKGIVFGVDNFLYKGKGIGDKAKVAFMDCRDSLAIYHFVRDILRPKMGDVFIFTTFEPWLSRHFTSLIGLYRFLHDRNVTVVAGIHNTFWFFPESQLTDREREWISRRMRAVKFHVRFRYWLTKKLVSPEYFSGFFTLGDLKIPSGIRHVRLLDRLYEGKRGEENSLFTVVVPGVVDKGRRDYETLASALDMLGRDVQVVLLGFLKDRDVVDMFKVKTYTFNSFVPEDEYKKWLMRADVVIAPVRDPYYGTFSVTGAIGDAVWAGVPVICPYFYRDSLCLNYVSAYELVKILTDIRDGKVSVDYSEYTLDAMADKFRRFIERVRV